jgi:ribonuclease HII
MLSPYQDQLTEAGCDEAGRGCFAGPVFASRYSSRDFSPLLNDSKQLDETEMN